MPIYKDDRNVITPLFDQIRRITETEDAMTFERATESLLNVTPGVGVPLFQTILTDEIANPVVSTVCFADITETSLIEEMEEV